MQISLEASGTFSARNCRSSMSMIMRIVFPSKLMVMLQHWLLKLVMVLAPLKIIVCWNGLLPATILEVYRFACIWKKWHACKISSIYDISKSSFSSYNNQSVSGFFYYFILFLTIQHASCCSYCQRNSTTLLYNLLPNFQNIRINLWLLSFLKINVFMLVFREENKNCGKTDLKNSSSFHS